MGTNDIKANSMYFNLHNYGSKDAMWNDINRTIQSLCTNGYIDIQVHACCETEIEVSYLIPWDMCDPDDDCPSLMWVTYNEREALLAQRNPKFTAT